MSDTAKQKMVKDFVVVTPDTTIEAAEAKLLVRKASYCVIQTSQGEPLALVTDEQLSALPDKDKLLAAEVANLPAAVPVEREQLLSDIVEEVSQLLFGSKQIRGLIVLYAGKVVGILSRQLIAEQALSSLDVRWLAKLNQIEGDPIHRPPVYVCRLGDHSEVVVSYDIDNPPRCPTHHSILIKKK